MDDGINALSAGEARFRDLIEKAADGVLVLRPDGVIVYANPAAGELLGQKPAALVGMMFGTPVTPGEPAELDLAAGAVAAELRSSEVNWEGGRAFLATLRDVTERRRVSATLRVLADAGNLLAGSLDLATTVSNVLRLATQHLADWCIVDLVEGDEDDTQTPYLRRTSSAEAVNGLYPAATAGTALARAVRSGEPVVYLTPNDAELLGLALDRRHLAAFRERGCRAVLVVPMAARGRAVGAITFLTAGGPRDYDDADQALARDLADRAALAIDNARLYDAARDALKRRDEFLATLAHELRNPLAPILVAAQLMKLHGLPSAKLEGHRETIERQGLHLAHLLDDLLDLSRVAHGKIALRKRAIDLGVVLRDALQVATGLLKARRHELTIDLPRGPLLVEGDPTRLAQVFGNLLKNAAHYTEPGGRVEVAARREGSDAVVRVKDSGRGIPREMLPRIFEPFVQVDPGLARSEGGLGIGLTLVHRLVGLHGGRVTVDSDGPGRGSVFEVRLPVAAVPPAAAEVVASVEMTPKRILLVEDNADGREMLSQLLRLWGHAVEGIADGEAALGRMRAGLPDVALIDIGLPGLDGYRLAEAVRSLPGGDAVLLVALTGYGMPEDRARTKAAGFDRHLVKPVDLRELAAALERGRG